MAINRFNARVLYTNLDTGETYRITDAGPDIEGDDTVAVTGRSITVSGVIGRVVFDLETGEIFPYLLARLLRGALASFPSGIN